MKLSHMLASSALASLLLVSGGVLPSSISPVAAVQAAANVSFSVFYNNLGSHGDWVRLDGRYVFVPARVGRNWRPYTVGHWVYGDNVGWTWASDEPFGWATYHYGRWGHSRDIGWYWVPGTRWAPAWVSWRRGGDVVAWAPLPPERDGSNVSVSISVGDIPDYYWVPVRTRNFLDVDLRVRVIDGDAERRRIVRNTKFIGVPRVRDRIVVNNVIKVNVIEKETGRKVKRVVVKDTNDPQKARASDEQVTVFQGEVSRDGDAKPKRVRDAAEVRKLRKERGDTADAMDNSGTPATGDDITTGTTTPPDSNQNADAPRKRKNTGQATEPDANPSNQDNANADQPAAQDQEKAGKKVKDRADAKQDGTAGQKDKAAETGKTQKKRKNANAGEEQGQAKKKKLQANGKNKEKNATAEKAQQKKKDKLRAAEQRGKEKKLPAGKKKQKCDPENNANCAM